MPQNFYYVYGLKDPRVDPPALFYIGKGTGSRAYDHLITSDKTARSRRLDQIKASKRKPVIEVLVDDLTEAQALKIEAELIAAFGTEKTGGPLTNSVIPSGKRSARKDVSVPPSALEKAQIALGLLKDAVVALLEANPGGLTNAGVAGALGLRSDHMGSQKDYLSYSLLGLLLREGRVGKKGARYLKNR